MKAIRMEFKKCNLSKAVCIEGDTVTFTYEEHAKKFLIFCDHTKKEVVTKTGNLEFPNNDDRHMFLHQLEDVTTIKDALKTLTDLGDYYHHVAGNKMLMGYLQGFVNDKNATYQAIEKDAAPALGVM